MTTLNKVRTVWTGGSGMPGYSTIYFSAAFNAQACVDAVRDALTVLAPGYSSQITATVDPIVTQVDDVTGDVTGTQVATQRVIPGTAAGNMLPVATQGLIGFRTGFYQTGRELRGKWYIPGMVASASTSAGAPTSTATLTLINAGNTLIGATPELVVYSPTKHVSAVVVSAYSPTKFAVLRSRRDN